MRAAHSLACRLCPSGKYSGSAGRVACELCAPGRLPARRVGASACVGCISVAAPTAEMPCPRCVPGRWHKAELGMDADEDFVLRYHVGCTAQTQLHHGR